MKLVARFIIGFLAFFPAYVLLPIDFVHADSVNCECVLYLRTVLGVNIHGNADTILPNIPKQYVEAGDVVLFHYAKEDHVALIVDVIQAQPSRPEIYVTIQESNFHTCTPDTRTISLDDLTIRGLYRPSFSTSQ